MKFLATLAIGICLMLPSLVNAFDLANFSAQSDVNQNVVLTWKTLSEQNNKSIHIQYSLDGQNFQTIQQIAGEGKANLSKAYQFTHQGVRGGQHFYRLRQITFTGEALFSAIKEVLIKKAVSRQILIAANPMLGDIIQVKVISADEYIDFNLMDAAGNIVYTDRVSQEKSEILIDMKKVKAGKYNFKLFSKNRILTKGQIELLK